MELLQLRYFLELAKTEHMTLTSANLHISQPALSSTIKKLEQELGVPLFERRGRNICLSRYGKVYKEYVQDVFFNLETGQKAVLRMKDSADNTFRLGILSPYVWSDLFAAFHEAFPKVIISRYSMEGNEYLDALLSGRIDMYIGGINNAYHRKLEYETLYTDNMVLLVNNSNPLSRYREVDLRACENENFLNLDRDTNLQQFISTFYQAAGFNPHVVMEVDYTLRDEMVAQNYGVSITTETSARKTSAQNVSYLHITYPPFRRKLGLVWSGNTLFTPSMEQFRTFAREYYRRESL